MRIETPPRHWRLEHLYKIVNKQGQLVKFRENEIQRRISANKAKRKMILKARQFGVSTGRIIRLFDKTINRENTTSAILAHENDAIEKLFRIVHTACDNMHPTFKPRPDKGGGSKYELYFPEINSRIYCDLESRGDTIQNLHVSEAAFFRDPNRLLATLQAVPLDGEVTIETTPNGLGNFFHDMWTDHNTTYERLFFPWYLHAEYKLPGSHIKELTQDEKDLVKKAKALFGIDISRDQIAFRRFKQSELKNMFIQEYPEDDASCFLSSGKAVMDLALISKLIALSDDPLEHDESQGLWVYGTCDKNKTYVIGCDPAEGVGGDFSVAVCIEVESRKIVGVIRGQWKPYDFADEIMKLADRFSGPTSRPLVGVERNNHGHAVLLKLNDMEGYPNLYVHTDEKLGWKTDAYTRPVAIDALIDSIESRILTVNDKNLLQECLTLVSVNGKIEAADGKHDDCVMACGIAVQLMSQSKSSLTDIENRILL